MSTVLLTACSNNPFNPAAELRIMDVRSTLSGEGRFAGIRQSAERQGENSFILYSYSDPVVMIENRDGLPPVDFKRFTAQITLSDGTRLPLKEYPLSKGMQEGGQTEIQFPILSADTDIRNVVYPGNNAPRVQDGTAEVTLYGTDLNGHNVQVSFTTALRFESLVFRGGLEVPTEPETRSTPAPTAPNPGGQ
ncbi:MAG: hypothetical protein IGS03_08815 [Candidatus Sericytochromatia bacterium]|nr:hypothetical protein [Candidatus Sericytochromatia bacterium]